MRTLHEVVGIYLVNLRATTCIEGRWCGYGFGVDLYSCHLNPDEKRLGKPDIYLIRALHNDETFEFFVADTLTEAFSLITKKEKELKKSCAAKK